VTASTQRLRDFCWLDEAVELPIGARSLRSAVRRNHARSAP